MIYNIQFSAFDNPDEIQKRKIHKLKEVLKKEKLKVFMDEHQQKIADIIDGLKLHNIKIIFETPKGSYTFYMNSDGTFDVKFRKAYKRIWN